MVRISMVILLGRWLDLYLMVLPPLAGDQPACGWPELGGLLLVTGIGMLFLSGGLRVVSAAEISAVSIPRVSRLPNGPLSPGTHRR